MKSWTIDTVDRGPVASTFELSTPDQRMACTIVAYRTGHGSTSETGADLRIKFVNPDVGSAITQAHASAEAARLLAMIYDTIGDLGRSPEDRVTVTSPRLELDAFGASIVIAGPDALIVAAPFFGDDACDELVSSPLFTLRNR